MAAEPNGEADDELADDEIPTTVHVTDDLNEYLEKQRYKAIFEAKENAAEVLRNAGAALGPGLNDPHDEMFVRERVSTAITGYITEVRRLLEETEQGQELWENTRLATIPIQNAGIVNADVRSVTTTNGLKPTEHEGTYFYILNGVADYLALHDTEATAEYYTEAAGRSRGLTIEKTQIDPYPPMQDSRTVYQKLTRLVSEVGLDLELGEPDEDEWEL
jgi:hypothetical protein